MKKTDNKGFSLVELIIVIAIMAILIGVLAPQYMKYVEKSRTSADKDTIDSIYNACTTAAADPDLTATPLGGATDLRTSITTSNDWGAAVLDTLGATDFASVTAKFKSKTCKGIAPTISQDNNDNFTVTVTSGTLSIQVPEN